MSHIKKLYLLVFCLALFSMLSLVVVANTELDLKYLVLSWPFSVVSTIAACLLFSKEKP